MYRARTLALLFFLLLLPPLSAADETSNKGLVRGNVVVLGWNDLGMHCMNEDFSEFMILPPYNTLHAQIIERRGEEPRLVKSGVRVRYSFPKNTTSSNKTNFWEYDAALFGVDLENDIGLTGNGLTGRLLPTGNNDWIVTGIPITPLFDGGKFQPYQLAKIRVIADGDEVASTRAVAPVSWEIRCDYCHEITGLSTAKSILRAHDQLHLTNLESQEGPVACMTCHAQAPLGTTGSPSLSHAMHGAHAARMDSIPLENKCYACHPGAVTQCLRGVHFSAGVNCIDCHGGMEDLADVSRSPWIDEPRCNQCHFRKNFEFEQAGTLYRDSKGHGGVHCAACHGSPHAISPTVEPRDNLQAIQWQGHAGMIDTCTVCHTYYPDDRFPHRYFEEDDDDR